MSAGSQGLAGAASRAPWKMSLGSQAVGWGRFWCDGPESSVWPGLALPAGGLVPDAVWV